MAFHFLQNDYFIEIHRGFCGVGEYSLRPKFGNLLRGKENIPVIIQLLTFMEVHEYMVILTPYS